MSDMYERNLFQGASPINDKRFISGLQTQPTTGRATELEQAFSTVPAPVNNEDEIFYNPKRVAKPTRVVPEPRAPPDESIGTLYREFTDTRVLNVMTSMERNNVRNIRQRYKGMHRRDLGPY